MAIIEIITIGLPFCAFKILSGFYFQFIPLVVLGFIDLLINVVNLCSLMFLKRRVLDTCFLAFIVRLIKKPIGEVKSKWEDLGNALDVLLSFFLVAYVIGGGYIGQLPQNHLIIWNISVVLNVMGAGLSRLTISIRNLP